MPKNNETTTKFKVDISELVSGMQKAKRQIALANAEFKSATAGMDDWSKSADGVSAKLSQLDKTLSSQTKILDNLEEQYRLTAQQMGADSKEAENLRIKIENQKASIGKTEKEIRKYKSALSEIKGEANQSKTAMEQLEDTISSQEDKLKDLKTAYGNAVLEYGKNSKEAKNLAKEIRGLSGELNDSKASMKEASTTSAELSDNIDDAGKSAESSSGGFTIMKGALANLVAEGISKAVEGFKELIGATDEASNKFQASTGASAEAMAEYNDAIEAIYKNNFGESLGDVAEKMAKVKEVTGELDAGKLQEMTEAGITLEDTFGMDMTESLRGVKSLMDHFGISATEAFDLMASGAQNGLNYTDELGDNVAEYAGKFAEAGYTTEEYFQLLKNGSQGGAYNLDKVNDSINEVTARLADGTIEKGIGGFSQSTQDLFKAWQNGEATQKDVIDSIVKDIQNTTSEQEKMNLSALAFGTMAEDGGTKFIESLSAVGDSFDDTKGKMDEIKQIRYDDVMTQLSGLGRTVKTDLITPFVEELLPYLKDGVQYVIDNMPAIKEAIQPAVNAVGDFISWIVDNKDTVIAGIAGIGAGFVAWNVATMIQGVVGAIKAFKLANEGATISQILLNAVMKANPIILIVSLIAGLIVAIGTFIATNDDARAKFEEVWGAIKDFFMMVWESYLKPALNAIGELFKKVFESIKSVWETYLQPVFQAIGDVFTNIWTNYLQPALVAIGEKFNEIFSVIKNIWESVLQPVFQAIATMFQWLWDVVISVILISMATLFTAVWKTIESLWNNVLKPVFDGIGSVFKFLWETILKPILGFIKDAFNVAFNNIKMIWNKILKPVFDAIGKAFTKVWTDYLSPAIENIKSAFQGMSDTLSQIWTTLWDGIIKPVINSILGGVESMANGVVNGINMIIRALNNLSFDIPDWVPEFGGKSFGFNIKELANIELPRLAGGIGKAEKGKQYLLEGDGDEMVLPLAKDSKWLDEVASRIVDIGGLSGNQAQTVNNNYNYEYNQTNNSPKALNRLEIYRQTRNQFNYSLGGAI